MSVARTRSLLEGRLGTIGTQPKEGGGRSP